jgi:hypothetical protein
MLHAVPGDERHLPALDGSHGHRSGRLPPWRVEVDLANVVEQGIEPRAAEDADADRPPGIVAVQADFSFDFDAGVDDPESDPEPSFDPEDPDPDDESDDPDPEPDPSDDPDSEPGVPSFEADAVAGSLDAPVSFDPLDLPPRESFT